MILAMKYTCTPLHMTRGVDVKYVIISTMHFPANIAAIQSVGKSQSSVQIRYVATTRVDVGVLSSGV